MINAAEGTPFDLPAAISLLKNRKGKIFDHIIKQGFLSEEKPLILFCGGSIVDGGIPYIKITSFAEDALEIGVVPTSYKKECNGYQLRYVTS